MGTLAPMAQIERNILLLRGHRVILSTQLAELYVVQVKVLIQAVKRNAERFPEDFMFQLSDAECDLLPENQTIPSFKNC